MTRSPIAEGDLVRVRNVYGIWVCRHIFGTRGECVVQRGKHRKTVRVEDVEAVETPEGSKP